MHTASFMAHLHICLELLKRDMYLLKKNMWGKCLDGILLTCTQLIMYGKLFPLLGMPKEYILPIYVGSTTLLLFISLGFTMAINIVISALHEGHAQFEYFFTLPCPKKWIFVYHVLSFVIETALITLPLLLVGIFCLADNGGLLIVSSAFSFFPFYFASLTVIATFFLAIAFVHRPQWFLDNVWPRRIGPLMSLSSAFFSWKLVASYAPIMGTVLLLNPMTYITEGIRATLLPHAPHISLLFCCAALALFFIFCCYLLQKGVYKQLDPV